MNGQIAKGDKVKYESLAGEKYDAVVVFDRGDGFFDIDVSIPGVKEPWGVKAVRAERLRRSDAGLLT